MKLSSLFLLCFLFSQIITAQTLAQKLGGMETSFKISCNGDDLEVSSQAIVLRPNSKIREGAHPVSVGSNVMILEFIAKKQMLRADTIVSSYLYVPTEKFLVTFTSADGTILLENSSRSQNWNNQEIVGGTEQERLYFYSVNLEEYPTVLIDKTAKIDIVWTKNVTNERGRRN